MFSLIHYDVWGSHNVKSHGGARNLMIFSCAIWIFLIGEKSEVRSIIPKFYKIIETQFNAKIKHVCSNIV